jgi:membrane protease YdiL (CAAX protease family)
MTRLIRALPAWAELGIVILAAFGFFIFRSVVSLFMIGRPVRTTEDLKFLIIYELVGLVLLLPFLHIRGWTLERLGLGSLSYRDGLVAVGLSAIAFMAYAGVFTAAALAAPDMMTAIVQGPALWAGGVGVMDLGLVCLVNPFFEEVFVSGYVIAVLDPRRTSWIGINVSVAIRLLYHLYQGPVGVLSIVPFGLVFAWWYARTGRLWPLVIAHALFDFFPLAGSVGG